MKKKHIPKRNPDQTTLHVSVPAALKAQIEAAAAADMRSVSNYLTLKLLEMLNHKPEQSQEQTGSAPRTQERGGKAA